MNFTINICEPTVSDGFTLCQELVFFILDLSDLLRYQDDIIFIYFLLFWIFENCLFLLLLQIGPDWHCIALYLHVIDHFLLAFIQGGLADDEELLHHAVQEIDSVLERNRHRIFTKKIDSKNG